MTNRDHTVVGTINVPVGHEFRQEYQTASWHTTVLLDPGSYDVLAYDLAGTVHFYAMIPGEVISSYTPASFGGFGGNITQQPQYENHRDVGTRRTVSVTLPINPNLPTTFHKTEYGNVRLDRDVIYITRRPTFRQNDRLTECYEVVKFRLGTPLDLLNPDGSFDGYILNVGVRNDGSTYRDRNINLRVAVYNIATTHW